MIRIFIMLLALTVALPVRATTIRSISEEELVGGAERVVVGTVVTREGRWSGTRIFTHHSILVEQTWRGPTSDRLTVLTAGGRVGDLGQKVVGAAQLRVGQRVVLFLVPGKDGAYHPLGMAQGVCYVNDDEDIPIVYRNLDGVRVIGELPLLPNTLSGLRDAVREVRRVP